MYSEDIGPVASTGSLAQAMADFENNPAFVFPFPISGCPEFVNNATCTLHPGPSFAGGVGQVKISMTSSTSFTSTEYTWQQQANSLKTLLGVNPDEHILS
jgi:hypothetical protein